MRFARAPLPLADPFRWTAILEYPAAGDVHGPEIESLRRSPRSVLDRDRVRPESLAARTGKQCEGAPGDERQRAVGRVDRENLDLVAHVIQRIEEVVRTIECQSNGSPPRLGPAHFCQRARARA